MAHPIHATAAGADRPRGVVQTWITASAHASQSVLADLHKYTAELGDTDEAHDLDRRWLTLDWFIRAAAPHWLLAIGLAGHAAALRGLPQVRSQDLMSTAAGTVMAAADAANGVHGQAWSQLLDRAGHHCRQDGAPAWRALVDGAYAGIRSTRMVLDPAAHAVGLPTDGRGPDTWRAAVASITQSASALACHALSEMTRWATWSWQLAPGIARGLTYTTVRAALLPVETTTHSSACELLAAMHNLPTGGPSPMNADEALDTRDWRAAVSPRTGTTKRHSASGPDPLSRSTEAVRDA